eukprot:scaffold196506_cov18-Tisochrysis_lutea.AAC.1
MAGMQALYEASKRAKAGAGAKGAAGGPPERLDKRTLMQEAFTERMREQQVGLLSLVFVIFFYLVQEGARG